MTNLGDVRSGSFNLSFLCRPVRKAGECMSRVQLVESSNCRLE